MSLSGIVNRINFCPPMNMKFLFYDYRKFILVCFNLCFFFYIIVHFNILVGITYSSYILNFRYI